MKKKIKKILLIVLGLWVLFSVGSWVYYEIIISDREYAEKFGITRNGMDPKIYYGEDFKGKKLKAFNPTFDAPTQIRERSDINYGALLFDEWKNKSYNPKGYVILEQNYNSETGYSSYKSRKPLYLVEENLYNEFKKYRRTGNLINSKLGKDVWNQMVECEVSKAETCRLTLKESLIQ